MGGAIHQQQGVLELEVGCELPLPVDLVCLAQPLAILDGNRWTDQVDRPADGEEERRPTAAAVRAKEN